MYKVIINYYDSDGDREVEIESGYSKKEAQLAKETYEKDVSKLENFIPDFYSLKNIVIEKEENKINWGWMIMSILIVSVTMAISGIYSFCNKDKIDEKNFLASPSSYSIQELELKEGQYYDIKVIGTMVLDGFYRSSPRYCLIFKLEQNGTIKYIEIHDTISKKNFSSLSNIQKLNQGDQCTIYKKDGVIKYK
jgi:hypothetical protein